LLLLAVLLINERFGFYRSRRARQTGEGRGKFTRLQTALLFALLFLGIFISITAWVT
jgi:hypothetical protein